jgi:ATP-dependent DNA helicase RecG
MRPEILFDLFAPTTTLNGVGPRIAKAIETLRGDSRIIDLLWHFPQSIIDRRHTPTIEEAIPGSVATITVTIGKHRKAPNKRAPYRIPCHDDSGKMTLVFFHAREDYLTRLLPEGETRIISGQVEDFSGEIQMTHPDHVVTVEEREMLEKVEPVYGLTAGLSQKVLGKTMLACLSHLPELPEWLDAAHQKTNQWASWNSCMAQVHAPESLGDLSLQSIPRCRLAYDELLANQLALAVVRRSARKFKGKSIKSVGTLRNLVVNALPFALTQSQQTAYTEIEADMATAERMLRLLQGDVGSGKTVVALMAMLNAVDAGCQACLMVPTEILARQHHATITQLCDGTGLNIVILTGREKGKSRTKALDDISNGSANIIIGTHALFQDDIAFKDLAFAVIDEQHRFGVHQRLMLAGKGENVDVLVMTATPIPRTLTLTTYGDMEVSRLTEKPAGRQPIDTRIIPATRLEEVAGGLARSIASGARVYWVCPLVEESEKIDAAAAEERHDYLVKQFGANRVGLVHGRMKGADKDTVMAAFKEGALDILVATAVIEVGVDVPEATVMIIEHAERFGLAQLHQLRGRIGRGEAASACVLMYGSPVSETAKQRMKVMRDTDDGFVIAEKDLELRGAGELLGTRQSGVPVFKVADLAEHGDLLATARRDAQLILETDTELESGRGKALRVLLYLFERDSAIRNLRSG